jgi:3-dehydroquinate synthase
MVVFSSDIAALNTSLGDLVKPYTIVFVLCDENTGQHCLPKIMDAISGVDILTISSGEKNKNLQTCEHIWTELTNKVADRRSLLINLGGGVICDMGGFAASCYKRGIDFVNIPTTLLGMVDASVGGKTGVDFHNFKNQIGVFSEAKEVLICNEFLKTLDQRQIRSGLAEIVKHYLIADEQAFRDFAEADRSEFLYPDIEIIKKAIAIKSAIVEADPWEKNVRKKLNFGHTIGHALESIALQTNASLLHGEAVAFGMGIETFISAFKSLIEEKDAELICYVLHSAFGLQALPEVLTDHILAYTIQDKKNTNGVIKMSLINAIGSCLTDIEVSADEIRRALAHFNKSMDWYNK